MQSSPLSSPTPRTPRNHGLFSDHYLNVTLPDRPDWRALADEAREDAVGVLISPTASEQESRRDFLDWLRVEFGIEKPGQKLEDYAALEPDVFIEEIRKHRPKSEGRLTPATLKDLRTGHAEQSAPVREGRAEAARFERRLSSLVNEAYGLTPQEIDLLWKTAPPRMSRF